MEQPLPWRRFVAADLSPLTANNPAVPQAGRSPSWNDFRSGSYHPRPAVFEPLWQAFHAWCHDEPAPGTAEEKLRVFLIEGRAGEGKSVLLRQLLVTCLRGGLAPEIDWLAPSFDGGSFHAPPPDDLDVVFVDELPSGADGAIGHRWMSRVCAAGAVALITTGGPRARRELRERFGGLLEITAYPLPAFTAAEGASLASWWAVRTGRPVDPATLWREGLGLTEFLFTLHHGKPLAALTAELRLSLGNLGLGGRIKFVWLANALGWGVPAALLAGEAARLHARNLAERNVVPLQIDEGGLRLAPPALAWEIALHWAGEVRDWRFQWVESLQFALKLWVTMQDGEMPGRLLRHLIDAGGLASGAGPREACAYGTLSRRELARELYRAHRRDFAGDPAPTTLEGWLALNEELALMLLPDPAECATEVFLRTGLGREEARTPVLAAATWFAADSRRPPLGPASRQAVGGYFLGTAGGGAGSGRALAKIVRTSRKSAPEARQLAVAWLNRRPGHPEAPAVREALALPRPAAAPPAPSVPLSPAPSAPAAELAWLEKHRQAPQAAVVLERRLTEDTHDPALRRVALRWLAARPEHSAAPALLRLLAAVPDAETASLAALWCDRQTRPADVHADLLCALLRALPGSAAWLARGEAYVRCPGHPGRERVAGALLLSGGVRPSHVRLALALREELAESAQTSLTVMLGDALARHPAQAGQVFREGLDPRQFAVLARAVGQSLAGTPALRPAFIDRAFPALPPEPACALLNGLLRKGARDPEVLKAAIAWLGKHFRERGYGLLLSALHTQPATAAYLETHPALDPRLLTDFRKHLPA